MAGNENEYSPMELYFDITGISPNLNNQQNDIDVHKLLVTSAIPTNDEILQQRA